MGSRTGRVHRSRAMSIPTNMSEMLDIQSEREEVSPDIYYIDGAQGFDGHLTCFISLRITKNSHCIPNPQTRTDNLRRNGQSVEHPTFGLIIRLVERLRKNYPARVFAYPPDSLISSSTLPLRCVSDPACLALWTFSREETSSQGLVRDLALREVVDQPMCLAWQDNTILGFTTAHEPLSIACSDVYKRSERTSFALMTSQENGYTYQKIPMYTKDQSLCRTPNPCG